MTKAKTKKKPAKTPAKRYEPTPQERTVATQYLARTNEAVPAPRLVVSEIDGVSQVSIDHPELALGQILLMESLGTTYRDFADGLVRQLVSTASLDQAADEQAINFMLSVIKGVEPRDQLEAMLAAQMAAIHNATMTFARRLGRIETIPQQDSAERALNKLARTFTLQMEALRKYRNGGEQKVTVQHVNVNEGGQAIVGSVQRGGGADGKP
jgi:hypothetical protein